MNKTIFLILLFILGQTAIAQEIPVIPMTKPVPKPKPKTTHAKPKPAPVKTKIIYVDRPVATPKEEAKTNLEPEMVYVQGGSFNMGSNESADEKPIHRVTVNSFEMSKYEITQAQWKAVMKTNPSYFTECNNCPVETVSYTDVQDFIEELNYKTGKKYRLPTEAEWEFAARGGNSSNNYNYSGSSTLSKVAWTDENSGRTTHSVGSLRPNELGLYDMSGNVWEWCSDWYAADYYANSPSSNPTGPSSGSDRVLRGGSWYGTASNCRFANRTFNGPSSRYNSDGFRVVLSR